MKLILGDSYPFPYPSHLSEAEQDEINQSERGPQLALEGVKSVEWRFTLTVEFHDHVAMRKAQAVTNWEQWGTDAILQAPTSLDDGREFPAVLINNRAYCQIFLEA
jgi:hypothetical protein